MTIQSIHDFFIKHKTRAVIRTNRAESRVEIRVEPHLVDLVMSHFESDRPIYIHISYRALSWWDLKWKLRKHKVVVELR